MPCLFLCRRLDSATDKAKSVLVIGGGFLGSEIACALGKKSLSNGMKVTQVFPESGTFIAYNSFRYTD